MVEEYGCTPWKAERLRPFLNHPICSSPLFVEYAARLKQHHAKQLALRGDRRQAEEEMPITVKRTHNLLLHAVNQKTAGEVRTPLLARSPPCPPVSALVRCPSF